MMIRATKEKWSDDEGGDHQAEVVCVLLSWGVLAPFRRECGGGDGGGS